MNREIHFQPSNIGTLLLTVLTLLILAVESNAQLNETWIVTVAGQSTPVNADGTFRIGNISAPDNLGPQGPAPPRDFLSDEFLRVTGTGFINGVPHWAFSEFFQIPDGETYVITNLTVTPTPPPNIDTLTLDVASAVLEPAQQTQATTTALLNDGTIVDVTPRSTWTIYRTSNVALASVGEAGLITGHKAGKVVITATNEGTAAAKVIDVVAATALTTVEGFVQLEDGTPAAGADVALQVGGGIGGGADLTDADGFFSISAFIPADVKIVSILAEGTFGGGLLVGDAGGLVPVADGFTDAGIITLHLPPCDGQWAEGLFCPPGLHGASNGQPGFGEVFAMTTWDDGTGPALYAAGKFNIAGCTHVVNVAKWDGSTWSALGGGLGGLGSALDTTVSALTVFDDGTGSALYAAGHFGSAEGVAVHNIAKWDGTSWTPLGGGTTGPSPDIFALAVFDDGTGPALYAGGSFRFVEGVSINRIARWHPNTGWSGLGAGIGGFGPEVRALTVFDDGTGPALYAGGDFATAGGLTTDNVAKWDGLSWSALGSGTGGNVNALTVLDDGTGPALFAGGFLILSGIPGSSGVAKWDGAAWSPLAETTLFVESLAVFNDGTGPALYAGGTFTTAGSLAANHIFKWQPGIGFSTLGTGMDNNVNALTTFDDGSGESLYIGGRFLVGNGIATSAIAKWDGSALAPVPAGGGLTSQVFALTVFDDGAGPALYAGGHLLTAGDSSAHFIAKWDGLGWSPLGAGLNTGFTSGGVDALAVFDDGIAPALYAGGRFSNAEGMPAVGVAKWDGSTWSALGTGVDGTIQALEVFDDGTGSALYTGGTFSMAGGQPADSIAKWDGSAWSPLGSGLDGFVFALTVFDDGTGPALYAGGEFTTIAGVPANRIARLCGSTWSPLGTGLDAGVNIGVFSLTVFDDGTGPALYVGGHFDGAGGVAAQNIAKWDGSAWSPLGLGTNRIVHSLAVFDDGTGPDLYAGGNFFLADGASATQIAKWDGFTWSPLGLGVEHELGGIIDAIGDGVAALQVFDDGSGPALFAGGESPIAGGAPSTYIAKWQRPQTPCPIP